MSKSEIWRCGSILLAVIVLAGAVTACSPKSSGAAMAPMSQMPANVQAAPASVREAYQYAAANPTVLKAVPCYCGCGAVGHTSNYSCYISGQGADGSLRFDNHALGCSICVDITHDAIRLASQGKDLKAIRASIDGLYSRYGPSNMPG